MITRADLDHLLGHASLMTISTVASSGRPQAAVVNFATTPELEIILCTRTTSRKYANLARDPHAALVIGWDDRITAQCEGLAEMPAGAELDRCKQMYLAKHPQAKLWIDEPTAVFVKVRPTWIRYSDLNHHPWEIKEFTF